jgi:hypothetical protein
MPRFALLEHTAAPDDPAGRHFDLLLEPAEAAAAGCRTWRLAAVPVAGGGAVPAAEVALHRLAWLDHEAGEVSGGRGFARRVDAGDYEPLALDADDLAAATRLVLHVTGDLLAGRLRLAAGDDAWTVRLD